MVLDNPSPLDITKCLTCMTCSPQFCNALPLKNPEKMFYQPKHHLEPIKPALSLALLKNFEIYTKSREI